jgi:hypothetical protein
MTLCLNGSTPSFQSMIPVSWWQYARMRPAYPDGKKPISIPKGIHPPSLISVSKLLRVLSCLIKTQCPRVQYPVRGGNKYRNLALLVGGVSKIETMYYAHESRGTQIWERLRWRFPAKTEKYRPDFSLERAPHINKPETVKKIFKVRMGNLVAGSRWVPDTNFDFWHA